MAPKKKRKVKKVIKKRKRITSRKPKKRNLGRKIEVKEIKEEKAENVYGSILAFNEMKNVYADLDFSNYNDNLIETKGINDQVAEEQKDYNPLPKIFPDAEYNEKPENDFEELPRAADYNEPFSYLTLRQKNIIMYIAVASIMTVVVVFWIFSVKQSISQSIKKDDTQDLTVFERSEEIKQSLNEIQRDFLSITNQIQNKQKIIDEFTDRVQQKVTEEQFKNKVIDQLKNNLENLNLNTNLNVNSNQNLNSIQ